MGGSAGGREVPAERDTAGTQGRESPEPSDGGRAAVGGGGAAGKASREHMRKPHRRPGVLASPWGQRGPRPTCPIRLPALGELRLWGAPQALSAASPIGPQARPPVGAPLPPGPHQPLHLVCQPAALPGGKRAQEAGSGQGGRRTRGPCRGWQRPGRPSLGPGPGLGQGSEGRAGQGRGREHLRPARVKRPAHLVRGRGPGSSTRYWSMIFSTSFCFSRRRALSWSLGGWGRRRWT